MNNEVSFRESIKGYFEDKFCTALYFEQLTEEFIHTLPVSRISYYRDEFFLRIRPNYFSERQVQSFGPHYLRLWITNQKIDLVIRKLSESQFLSFFNQRQGLDGYERKQLFKNLLSNGGRGFTFLEDERKYWIEQVPIPILKEMIALRPNLIRSVSNYQLAPFLENYLIIDNNFNLIVNTLTIRQLDFLIPDKLTEARMIQILSRREDEYLVKRLENGWSPYPFIRIAFQVIYEKHKKIEVSLIKRISQDNLKKLFTDERISFVLKKYLFGVLLSPALKAHENISKIVPNFLDYLEFSSPLKIQEIQAIARGIPPEQREEFSKKLKSYLVRNCENHFRLAPFVCQNQFTEFLKVNPSSWFYALPCMDLNQVDQYLVQNGNASLEQIGKMLISIFSEFTINGLEKATQVIKFYIRRFSPSELLLTSIQSQKCNVSLLTTLLIPFMNPEEVAIFHVILEDYCQAIKEISPEQFYRGLILNLLHLKQVSPSLLWNFIDPLLGKNLQLTALIPAYLAQGFTPSFSEFDLIFCKNSFDHLVKVLSEEYKKIVEIFEKLKKLIKEKPGLSERRRATALLNDLDQRLGSVQEKIEIINRLKNIIQPKVSPTSWNFFNELEAKLKKIESIEKEISEIKKVLKEKDISKFEEQVENEQDIYGFLSMKGIIWGGRGANFKEKLGIGYDKQLWDRKIEEVSDLKRLGLYTNDMSNEDLFRNIKQYMQSKNPK